MCISMMSYYVISKSVCWLLSLCGIGDDFSGDDSRQQDCSNSTVCFGKKNV